MELTDKVAIVTGAASGIGKEIALAFAKRGTKIGIADIDVDGANATVDAIRAQGGDARAWQIDVTSESHTEEMIRSTVAEFGSVDILVSNAGIQELGEIVDFSFAGWKRMLATHLDGAFLMTRGCLRRMYEAGRGGAIVYIGSVHSMEASRLKGPYTVAKHGVLGLCRAVAREGGPHRVRANVICPGFVKTEMLMRQLPALATALGIPEEDVMARAFESVSVDGEMALPSDVADVAVFLAAFPTMALTGQSIVVSHGWHMN